MKTCERAKHLLKTGWTTTNLAEFFIRTNWQDGRCFSDEPEGVHPDEDSDYGLRQGDWWSVTVKQQK